MKKSLVSEQLKPKDVVASVKRRELLQTALLGNIALAGLVLSRSWSLTISHQRD
ncbi:MAG: hypothetical protein ACO2PN_25590 [Pyrobaculum sp.]